MATRPVTFYFDFISPYSFLASQLISRSSLSLLFRPVVLGTMLSKRGVKGPGEIPSRRRIGLEDLLLLSAQYGIAVQGPPAHPFNPIYALRSVCAVPEAARAGLTDRYFRACWVEGRRLDDLEVLRDCLREMGIDQDPEEAATDRTHRAALKANTAEAMEAGAWGVPSFRVDDLIFFGHDRLELLERYLDGRVTLDRALLADMLAR